MPIDILVPVQTYPDGNAPGLAAHAAAVASHLGASLHGLMLEPEFPQMHSPLAGLVLDVPAMIAGARARSAEHGAVLADALRAAADAQAVALRMTSIGYLPAELADRVNDISRYHDLTLLGLGDHDAALRGTAEEVIFGSGRPVLLVPEDMAPRGYGSVAIAWDGSRVAARAVADAAPILNRATAIKVLCVRDEKALPGADIGARLVDHLTRRGLSASLQDIRAGSRPIGDSLQDHALELGAGLLVMGGFGHNRMRDFVLGGATSGVLRELRLPVLISH